ncbi:glycosyltransferase family 1 protein [Pedobacter gandavensis]|uniref:glycosyltransferase family 4 protein n=1 Tax=Pedobacter gandavensis TaxID=2679963 RepID=UPI00292E64CA|nr:glycosyltransferase family 1 protein [Pedobacter gandavensis]
MKILYDYQMFDAQKFGGISRYFANLISGMKAYPEMKEKVSVLFTNNYYLKDKKKWKFDHAAWRLLFKNPKRLTKWNKNYSKFCIKKGDYDLFHPTYYNPYFLKFLEKKFVITVHDMIYELYPQYFGALDHTPQNKRKVIAAATHIIAISETTKQDLMRFLEVPEEKITVIYHGHTPIRNENEPALDLPENYVLFVGSRDDYKNFGLFSDAMALLMQKDETLHLVCTGGGVFTESERAALQKLGILARTGQYQASDEGLYWIYKKARLFAYPSLYEGFGLPILEAFEADCPVVLSDTPSFVEVAADAALFFDPKDPQQMADAFLQVLSDQELSTRLIVSGRNRLKEFSMEDCVARTIAVYKKCGKN